MIYEPTDRGKQELEIYLTDLRKIGNHVVEAVETMGEWRTENGTEKSGTVSIRIRHCDNLSTSCFDDSTVPFPLSSLQKCLAL